MNRAVYVTRLRRYSSRSSNADVAIAADMGNECASIHTRAQASGSGDLDQQLQPFDDSKLIRAVQRGDTESVRTLLDRYCRKAYLLAFRRLGDHTDAEIAVERAFIELVEDTIRFSTPDEFAAMFYSIVRKYAPFRTAPLATARLQPRGYGVTVLATGRSRDHAEILALFQCAMASCTPPVRVAAELHAIDGVSIAEISTMLGHTVPAVLVQVQKGHAAFCDALARAGPRSTRR